MLCEIFQPQAEAKGLELTVSIIRKLELPAPKDEMPSNLVLGSTLPMMMGDERRFKQVLINLVKNALKFTRQGSIRITAGYDFNLNSIVVMVKDTGAGISQEDFPLLFTRFGKL